MYISFYMSRWGSNLMRFKLLKQKQEHVLSAKTKQDIKSQRRRRNLKQSRLLFGHKEIKQYSFLIPIMEVEAGITLRGKLNFLWNSGKAAGMRTVFQPWGMFCASYALCSCSFFACCMFFVWFVLNCSSSHTWCVDLTDARHQVAMQLLHSEWEYVSTLNQLYDRYKAPPAHLLTAEP